MTTTQGTNGIDQALAEAIMPDEITADKVAWVPTTREDFEWVLETVLNHRVKAEAHRAKAAEVTRNCESMARDEDRQAEWMLLKFGPAMRAFAQQDIEGNTGRPRRSVKTPFGVIGFKTKPQQVAIRPGQAPVSLAWAREHHPELVVEGVDKKALCKIAKRNDQGEAVDGDTGEALEWLEVVPPSDPFDADTFFVEHPSLKKAKAKPGASGPESDAEGGEAED